MLSGAWRFLGSRYHKKQQGHGSHDRQIARHAWLVAGLTFSALFEQLSWRV